VPACEVPFDKNLAVNALQFWDEPVGPVRELRRVLGRGGRIAIAFSRAAPGLATRGEDAGPEDRHGAARRRLLAGAA
jgi:hypothetical protein